jgi:four helix bundle protein
LVVAFYSALLFSSQEILTVEKTNFEKLEIYQVSEKLADKIWAIVIRWDWFAKETVGKQLVKAADSIGSNISEGSGRGSRVDYCRFLKIARGSFNETKHWLRRAYRRMLITHEQAHDLAPLVEKLGPKLNAYLRSVASSEHRNVAKKSKT